MHVITIDKIEVMNMEESKEEYIGGLGKKREGEMLCTCVCVCTHRRMRAVCTCMEGFYLQTLRRVFSETGIIVYNMTCSLNFSSYERNTQFVHIQIQVLIAV